MTYSITLPPNLRERIENRVKELGTSVADYMRVATAEKLERENK